MGQLIAQSRTLLGDEGTLGNVMIVWADNRQEICKVSNLNGGQLDQVMKEGVT